MRHPPADDFYPRNPASWLAHLPACAFNSLLMGELAVPDWVGWVGWLGGRVAGWWAGGRRDAWQGQCPAIASAAVARLPAPAHPSLCVPPTAPSARLQPSRQTPQDMFHSKHEAALLHATARAVSGAPPPPLQPALSAAVEAAACSWSSQSGHQTALLPACSLRLTPALPPNLVVGGPVYVSDRPGHHDHALLRRLVLPDGGLLRCSLPGRPTADCLMADPCRDGATALKVGDPGGASRLEAVWLAAGCASELC